MKAITAGLIIGLCVEINKRVGGVCGAVLFGIGLVTICACELPLFTGRVGGSRDLPTLTEILTNNIIGISAMALAFTFIPESLMIAVGCGMLMQIGVVLYRKGMAYVTVMCVAAFILSGFKHSIAMMYMPITLSSFVITIAGNAIGAKLLYYGGVRSEEETNDCT